MKSIDHKLMWPTLSVLAVLCVLLIVNIDNSTKIINSVLTWVQYKLGWLYLICMLVATVFSLWLAFGRYGKVKLSAPDEEPQFSLLSWFSMIFFTAYAAGIMIWGFVEPAFYYSNPPYGFEAFSSGAYEWSLVQAMFHWGPQGYTVYIPFAVGIAYVLHVRKEPYARVSNSCKRIIGEKRANGIFGKVLDAFVLFGIIGGISTSFGMAAPSVVQGISYMTGMEPTTGLMIGVLVVWTLVFGVSVYRGLEKGIKVLSHFNAILAAIFVTLVFVLGPSLFMLKMLVNSSGLYLDNVIRMSTFMDPISNTGFVESWTVFYWAWYLGFAVAVGIFIAKISKGRTIREVVIGTTVVLSLSGWIIQVIFGSYVIDLELNGVVAVSQILQNFGQDKAVLEILKTLPFSNIVIFLHTLLVFTFVATTLDSTAFTCASVASIQLKGDEEPSRINRVMWAVILLGVAGTLAAIGGLSAIQVSTVVASVPLMGILALQTIALIKMLREDFPIKD